MVLDEVASWKTKDVVVVVCNNKCGKVPLNCTFYGLSSDCNQAYKEKSFEFADQIAKSYVKKNKDVSFYSCKCELKETAARTKLQEHIERLELFPGGNHGETKTGFIVRERRKTIEAS